jgi:dUTP pyrophosphatase
VARRAKRTSARRPAAGKRAAARRAAVKRRAARRPEDGRIPIRRLPGHDDLPVPAAATAGSAGVDLRAAVREPLVLKPGQRALIPTGFAIALPRGLEGQVRPRSGLAIRHGLTLLNSPGTIDSDYRGEIAVVAVNLGEEEVTIQRGERIAQLVIAPVARTRFVVRVDLPPSGRGAGGFGHTGTR